MCVSYDHLTTPLREVTFCVVDLETTGASASACTITEVGAVKFRGGECLGTFQTLVDADAPISPVAARITGITDSMLAGAPPLPGVLAALTEFVGGAVLVGHNLRFDASFLDAALAEGQRPALRLHMVDTVALARGLVGDEVPDCRLATLAHHLGLDHRPTHRALDDALATADLLHVLLERAAGVGVATLDDVLALPRLAGHPQAAKLRLTDDLPRGRGVYLFRDARGRPLYVGQAADVRRRVRSFFGRDRRDRSSPEGRTVRQLLRTVHRIEHVVTSSALESAVATVRLVQALAPRHNRRSGRWRRFRYVRLPGRTPRPSCRPAVVPTVPGGAAHLGPFPSSATARAVADAIAALAPGGQCPPQAVAGAPDRGLGARLADLLAAPGAGERATLPAGTLTTLVAALRWQRRLDQLRRAGRVVLAAPDGRTVELRRGRLVSTGLPGAPGLGPASPGTLAPLWAELTADATEPPAAGDGALPREMAEELDIVATWLDRSATRARLIHVDGELSSEWPGLPAHPSPGSSALPTALPGDDAANGASRLRPLRPGSGSTDPARRARPVPTDTSALTATTWRPPRPPRPPTHTPAPTATPRRGPTAGPELAAAHPPPPPPRSPPAATATSVA